MENLTLFKNDDTLEIIYKLFQAYSYFFHQNKTDNKDKDFETRVTENKNKIDQILSWLEDSKDGEVTTQGILSKVKTLWTTVTDVSESLTKKVAENTNEISKLKTLVEDGWSEGEDTDTVSYQGYKVLIKDIYDKLSERITETALTNTLKNYYTKTDADKKFVAQVAGKQLSTEDFTTAFKTLLTTLRDENWVRPVEGKDLSDVNFTEALATKLNNIQEGATKTDITQTLSESETTVPSNKAVSTGLSAKVAKTDIVSTIDSSNSSALDKVPSCAAVSAFVDSKIPSTVDITSSFVTSEDTVTVDLLVSSQEANICFVRVTELSTSRIAINSYFRGGVLGNARNLTVFNLNNDSLGYLVELWKKIDDQPVLVKTFYTKQS